MKTGLQSRDGFYMFAAEREKVLPAEPAAPFKKKVKQ
jgi:hypothetical protein